MKQSLALYNKIGDGDVSGGNSLLLAGVAGSYWVPLTGTAYRSWTIILGPQRNQAYRKSLSDKDNASYGYRVQECNAGGFWIVVGAVAVTLLPFSPAAVTVLFPCAGQPTLAG